MKVEEKGFWRQRRCFGGELEVVKVGSEKDYEGL